MWTILTNIFFLLCLSVPFYYLYPNFLYNLCLETNFYYRKLLKYIEVKDKNITDINTIEVEDCNLQITNYKYNGQEYILLQESNKEVDIVVDENKYNAVRNSMSCPNSLDSFLMADLICNKGQTIDVLEEVKKLSGPYFSNITKNRVLIKQYIEHQYRDNDLLKLYIMMADGSEIEFSFVNN
jgi:hypothetical protein